MEELNLKELFLYFLKKWFIILITVIIVLGAGAVYTFGIKKPMYQSSTTIVLTRASDEEKKEITATDVQLNKQLISSYREIIKSKKVLGKVKEDYKLKYSVSKLRSMVEISNVKDTELIDIRVNSLNKKETANIANKISEVFAKEIKEIYHVQNVKTVDEAEESKTAYNINPVKDMLLFGVVGIVLAFGCVFVIYYFDTKIKTVEEVEARTGLSILGEIPVNEKKKGDKKWSKK